MGPVGVSTSALNVLPAHTPVRNSLCEVGGWGAELVPWRAAKSTCCLWLPEDVKTTAHFDLSVWGGVQQGGAVCTCREGAVVFAGLRASHTLVLGAVSLFKLPVFQIFPASPESNTEDIHAFPGCLHQLPCFICTSLRELSADFC